MAVVFLTAIDEFLLDRVFQPIADRLHQWCGATPNGIAEFLVIGSFLFTIAYHVLRDPVIMDFGSGTRIFSFTLDIIATLLLSVMIVYPRDSVLHGMNYKRVTLFFLRSFWLLCTLINLVTIPVLIPHAVNTFHALGMGAQFASQLCLWTAACFASLNRPPPRKQRESKLLTWLRPRYAT